MSLWSIQITHKTLTVTLSFQAVLRGGDIKFSDFPKLKEKYITNVDEALQKDIPRLMSKLPGYQNSSSQQAVESNPFEEEDAGTTGWTVTGEAKVRYEQFFNQLNPQFGKLSGGQVKDAFIKFGLEMTALRDIWNLSDIDKASPTRTYSDIRLFAILPISTKSPICRHLITLCPVLSA